MAHEFGVRLAQITFATSALQSALAGSAFTEALQTALMLSAGFYLLGFLCGETAKRLVEEQVQRQTPSGSFTQSQTQGR